MPESPRSESPLQAPGGASPPSMGRAPGAAPASRVQAAHLLLGSLDWVPTLTLAAHPVALVRPVPVPGPERLQTSVRPAHTLERLRSRPPHVLATPLPRPRPSRRLEPRLSMSRKWLHRRPSRHLEPGPAAAVPGAKSVPKRKLRCWACLLEPEPYRLSAGPARPAELQSFGARPCPLCPVPAPRRPSPTPGLPRGSHESLATLLRPCPPPSGPRRACR